MKDEGCPFLGGLLFYYLMSQIYLKHKQAYFAYLISGLRKLF